MHLAVKLGRDEEEIEMWPRDKFTKWMAFFRVVQEEEEKAIKAAQNKSKSR